MVSVIAALPTVTELGLKLVIAGSGLLIVKVKLFELPPPGDGLTTSSAAVPAVTKSLAGIVAVSCVLLTN